MLGDEAVLTCTRLHIRYIEAGSNEPSKCMQVSGRGPGKHWR